VIVFKRTFSIFEKTAPMRTILLFLLFSLGTAVHLAAQVRSSYGERWDPTQDDWIDESYFYYEYDEQGKPTLDRRSYYDPETNEWRIDSETRTEYFDNYGSRLITLWYNFFDEEELSPSNTTWEKYNENGALIESSYRVFDYNEGAWRDIDHSIYTYNNQNCVTSILSEVTQDGIYYGGLRIWYQDEDCQVDSFHHYFLDSPNDQGFLNERWLYDYQPDSTTVLKIRYDENEPLVRDSFLQIIRYNAEGQVTSEYNEQPGAGFISDAIFEYDQWGNVNYQLYRYRLLEPEDSPWIIGSESFLTYEEDLLLTADYYSEYVDSLDQWRSINSTAYFYDSNEWLIQEEQEYSNPIYDLYFGSTTYLDYFCDGKIKQQEHLTRSQPDIAFDYYYRSTLTYWDGVDCGPYPEQEELLIFPNPNSGEFTISHPELQGAAGVAVIYDSRGRTIQTIRVDYRSEEALISLPSLAQGMYFIQLDAGETVLSGKLVIQQ
jgi:hypothetical protein